MGQTGHSVKRCKSACSSQPLRREQPHAPTNDLHSPAVWRRVENTSFVAFPGQGASTCSPIAVEVLRRLPYPPHFVRSLANPPRAAEVPLRLRTLSNEGTPDPRLGATCLKRAGDAAAMRSGPPEDRTRKEAKPTRWIILGGPNGTFAGLSNDAGLGVSAHGSNHPMGQQECRVGVAVA